MSRETFSSQPQVGSNNLISTFHEVINVESIAEKKRWGVRMRSFLDGNIREGNIALKITDVASRVINEGKVNLKDVEHIGRLRTFEQASFLATFGSYYKMKEKAAAQAGTPSSYNLGLVIADFLEVIPVETAAKLILAGSDPDISESIIRHDRTRHMEAVDTQVLAAEGVILLPLKVQSEVLKKMVDLDPRLEGRGYMFYRNLMSSFYDRRSSLSAFNLVTANIPYEAGFERLSSINENLVNLGEELRSRFVNIS